MTQIDHPSYYEWDGVEVIDIIEAHNLNFNLGNVLKYVMRAGRKDSDDMEADILKAQWYLLREGRRLHDTEQRPNARNSAT